jgi:hypothetical protein
MRLPRLPATAITVALALTLTGCAGSDTAGTSSASTKASATSSATPTAGSGDVVALAQAFAASLSDEQREALNQDYTFTNAQNWSNLPNALLSGGGSGGPGGGAPPSGASGDGTRPSGAPGGSGPPSGTAGGGAPGGSNSTGRVGLQTDSLSAEQWTALEAVLAAATGSAANEGFDEIRQHLAADDYLGDNGGGDDYGRGNYFVAFLGTPAATGTWELQFGGHHLAVANTYVDGRLAGATPSFRGIEPFTTVQQGDETVQAEQQEAQAFSALLTSLDETQAATAKLSTSYNDLLLGPGNDWAFPTTAEGLAGAQLTADQKALLLAAIKTYVGDLDDADAARILATYESELDSTSVAFSGTTSMSEVGDYVRIDGPSVWIEFSQQNGIVLDGAHPHAVWRDKKTDYAGLTS